ncbi:cyclin-dependent kinase 11B-like [Lingula anatina]|uniref:cyclin-dependent kinase n=1 Tax=Lingula anatina TaxID=7574 RepID=A0A1S3JP63_LINAN|nr:cyclin-dependent kinase 11B-like [Lingula anatina]|eukprot:XP_013412148.1 cyclin-dependent kinase 11B-like [Lingula anatina]
MSDSEQEQGELSASPDNSPNRRVVIQDEESAISQHSSASAGSDREDTRKEGSIEKEERHEEQESLDIKPPQSQAGKKDKHKHKRKHREDRDRGKDYRKRGREGEKERGERGREGEKERGERGREQRQEKGPDQRERERMRIKEENIRREESKRERERLENMEREKRRERDMKERMARERERDLERRHRKGEPRSRKAGEDSSERRREERRSDKSRPDRSRSRHTDRQDREDSRTRGSNQRGNTREEEKRPSPILPPEVTPEHAEEAMETQEVTNDRQSPESSEESEKEATEQSESEAEEQQVAEESGSGESESESGSSSSGESEDSDSAEEEEEEQKPKPEKVRSKFDDQSSPEESETESVPEPSEAAYAEGVLDDTPPQSPVELKKELPSYYPAIQGCRSVEEFHCLNRIEEGTYGVVYRARDKKKDEIVALKRLKMEKEKEGFPITSIREINTILKAQHMNIVTVREIVVGSNMDKIYIVMDYVEHDLKSLMESMKQPFIMGEVKTLMLQLLRGVAHLHDNWIIHRDLKTSNLLLSHKGILKIGDFGLAREYGSPLRAYTSVVVTLWYRAPELLLGIKQYSTPIDMWSVGCIFGELLTMKPIFPGKSETDELQRIFKDLGTPNERVWEGVTELPHWKKYTFANYPFNSIKNRFGSYLSETGFHLLNKFLAYDPKKRITAEEALKHEFFQESPQPVDPSMFPTWPAKSEQPRRHGNTPKPPSGGKAYDLLGDDDDTGFQFTHATKGASAQGPGFSLKF